MLLRSVLPAVWSGVVGVLTLGAASLLAGRPAGAATTLPLPPSARFRAFTVEDGLSQNTVSAMLQDRHGFMWFGTEEGLTRFDGQTFAFFKHRPGDPTSLPSESVTALHEDGKGRLWVGTRGGLGLYDGNTETFAVRAGVESRVTALAEDPQGRLWIGTDGDGLFRIDAEGAPPLRYRHRPDDPASLSEDSVLALMVDKAGRLWIGTDARGLNRYDPDADRFIRYAHDPRDPGSLGKGSIWSLAEDRVGHIWVGTTAGGVSLLDPAGRTFRHYRPSSDPSSLPSEFVTALRIDSNGTMWVGTESGGLARHVDAGRFAVYRHASDNPDSLSGTTVRSIYEDVQGNLWVGTFAAGLNWLSREGHPFQYFTHRAQDPASLTGGGVVGLLEDRAGRLWIGADKWLNRFDPSGPRFTAYFVGAAVLALHQDRRGRIWLGTWGRGLLQFDPARGVFTSHGALLDDPDVPDDVYVWAIHEDPNGVLWLGTDDGIIRFAPDSRQVTRIRPDPDDPKSLAHDQIRAFSRDAEGRLWVGTLGGGLHAMQPDGTFVRYDSRQQAVNRGLELVIALHRDKKGRLWYGTRGAGLNLFDPEKGIVATYGQDQGLPSNVVYGILEEDGGRLWLSTNRGLCRFNPETKEAEVFDVTNGVQNMQFNLGAALKTASGSMLFGSYNGFYYFDPDRITPNKYVPPIVFTALKVLNEPRKTAVALPMAEELRLDYYKDKILTFEFAVLDFTFPRRNNYKYKLEGLNDDWMNTRSKHDATFTNLDPGTYVLRVMGTNSDGQWGERERALRIVIPPPFWATWWFRLTAVLATGALLFSAHRYRMRRLELREEELEMRVEEAMSRVKILRGLLPICATCKMVRDDKGYWSQIESYLRTHSEADFSHGICPDCIVKYWGHTQVAASLKKKPD